MRFNERVITVNTTRITTRNAGSMHSALRRERCVVYRGRSASGHRPRAEIRETSMWSCRRRCFSRGDVVVSPLRLTNSTSLQSFFMVYGLHRATESATTTRIAWLHNITTQGKSSPSVRFYLYKNCMKNLYSKSRGFLFCLFCSTHIFGILMNNNKHGYIN